MIAVTLALTATAAHAQQPTPEERLAAQFTRSAVRLLRAEPLPLTYMESSLAIIREAAALSPDDPEMWRLVAAIASLVEDRDVQAVALERIVELDPADEAARLKILSDQLREPQTAEELASVLEELLSQGSRRELGGAISSRLALDLALLQRRRGENEAFADRLAQAAALDPSNHEAAAIAIGYFQEHVDDPVAEGELLLQLVLANPTDIQAQVLLAAHLLGYGAYRGAERFYALAMRSHRPEGLRPMPDLVADAAMAQLGRGDAAGALRRLNEYQRQADQQYQQQLGRQRPELSPLERAAYSAILTPTFASVRAAILHRMDREVDGALAAVSSAYEQSIAELERAESEERISRERLDAEIATLRLEQAWVQYWLGGPIEQAQEEVNQVRATAELTEAAEARFAGWEALRAGEPERAIEMFEPYAADDSPSGIGLALALIETGQSRSAARQLLSIARAQPGTLIGVFAADRLAELLGQRAALTPEASELEALAAVPSRLLDRLPTEPTAMLSLRLVPERSRYDAYSPLRVNLEITNSAPFPLAIDPAGPVRPEILISVAAQAARAVGGPLQPIVIGLDRRLRLMPRERLIIPLDLRRTIVGDFLDDHALVGAIVRLRAAINFRATGNGAIVPGLLGSETSPQTIRIDGARVTRAWIEESVERLASPTDESDLPQIALLAYAVAADPDRGAPREARDLVRDARSAIASVFAAMDEPSQAWLLSVLPRTESMQSIVEPEMRADDRLVQLVYLMYRSRDASDPMVSAALRSSDATLRTVAQLVHANLEAGEDDPLAQDDLVLEEPVE